MRTEERLRDYFICIIIHNKHTVLYISG